MPHNYLWWGQIVVLDLWSCTIKDHNLLKILIFVIIIISEVKETLRLIGRLIESRKAVVEKARKCFKKQLNKKNILFNIIMVVLFLKKMLPRMF